MMDPQMLVDQAPPAGLPAPIWFIQLFKVLGFTLHSVPMNLWYAGLLIALGLHLVGGEHARRLAGRLLQQMPIIIALGVNLGVVPLLFVQLAYHRVFYPATILMAWFWLGIIGLLIPAYYGVYVYAWALRKGSTGGPMPDTDEQFAAAQGVRVPNQFSPRPPTAWRCPGEGQGVRVPAGKRLIGWAAAMLFLAIGFLFVNGLSLMDHISRWPELWKESEIAGATFGMALNIGDPTLWPRWLLMFGLALGTTAVWSLVDATWLTADATEAYHHWVWQFARRLYTVSVIWTGAAGAWYVFGTWSLDLRATMFQFPIVILTLLTAVAPGLPWLLIVTADRYDTKRAVTAGIAAAQFGVLGINAISRQIVQNVNLQPVLDIWAQPTDVQWSPLLTFLAVLVIGVGVLAWMLRRVVAVARHT